MLNYILYTILGISLIINCILFYYWRKEYLREEPITAKIYDFFRWVSVLLLFLIPLSEAALKKAGIEIVLISNNTFEVYKQTLIYFVLPHMLYSIKDFIPEATALINSLQGLKNGKSEESNN